VDDFRSPLDVAAAASSDERRVSTYELIQKDISVCELTDIVMSIYHSLLPKQE